MTNHDGFKFTGFNIWQADRGIVRGLYRVSDETAKWDGTKKRFALYSERHNVYSYCTVKVTGRKVRLDGNHRLTVQVEFDDVEAGTVRAEMLRPDGGYFEIDYVKLFIIN